MRHPHVLRGLGIDRGTLAVESRVHYAGDVDDDIAVHAGDGARQGQGHEDSVRHVCGDRSLTVKQERHEDRLVFDLENDIRVFVHGALVSDTRQVDLDQHLEDKFHTQRELPGICLARHDGSVRGTTYDRVG